MCVPRRYFNAWVERVSYEATAGEHTSSRVRSSSIDSSACEPSRVQLAGTSKEEAVKPRRARGISEPREGSGALDFVVGPTFEAPPKREKAEALPDSWNRSADSSSSTSSSDDSDAGGGFWCADQLSLHEYYTYERRLFTRVYFTLYNKLLCYGVCCVTALRGVCVMPRRHTY